MFFNSNKKFHLNEPLELEKQNSFQFYYPKNLISVDIELLVTYF